MAQRLPVRVRKYYLSAPEPHRSTMLEMRKRILKAAPRSEEVISYGMPAFEVDGVIIAGLMAAKNHVGYYPFSGSTLGGLKGELKGYSTTKSAIHVPIDRPLSQTLIGKLIRARLSQCEIVRGESKARTQTGLDQYWKELGIAAPARRGLLGAQIFKLRDLSKIKEKEFLAIHAIGPKSSEVIIREMKRKKVRFKP